VESTHKIEKYVPDESRRYDQDPLLFDETPILYQLKQFENIDLMNSEICPR
jgi:hypothetical protein